MRTKAWSGAIVCACTLTLAMPSAVHPLFPQAEVKPTYKMIAPELVEQGEEFTAQVVEETEHGDVPLGEGDQVSFHGQVVDVQHNGKIRVPAFARELGNTFLIAGVLRATQGRERKPEPVSMVPQHVEVVPPTRTGEPVRPQIAHAPEIVSSDRPIRIEGQGLTALDRTALVGRDGTQMALNDSVGSSLQRIYLPEAGTTIPKGTYRFVAWDAKGNRYDAPMPIQNPSMQIQGPRISRRNQQGNITVTSDMDGTVALSGGEPNIALESHLIAVHANQAAQVRFTAKQVGPYTLKARALNPEEVPPATQTARANTKPEPIEAHYDPARNETMVKAPVRVVDAGGRPLANVPVDMVVSHPNGVEYVRVNTDEQGRANFFHTFAGQVTAGTLSAHVYRVLQHAWKQAPGGDDDGLGGGPTECPDILKKRNEDNYKSAVEKADEADKKLEDAQAKKTPPNNIDDLEKQDKQAWDDVRKAAEKLDKCDSGRADEMNKEEAKKAEDASKKEEKEAKDAENEARGAEQTLKLLKDSDDFERKEKLEKYQEEQKDEARKHRKRAKEQEHRKKTFEKASEKLKAIPTR